MRVKIYQTETGKEPYWEWYKSIRNKDKVTARRVRNRLRRIEQGNFGNNRSLGKGLYELKFSFGQGYRIYVGRRADKIIVLLSGGAKRTQNKDIEQAKQHWEDYKQRVKNG